MLLLPLRFKIEFHLCPSKTVPTGPPLTRQTTNQIWVASQITGVTCTTPGHSLDTPLSLKTLKRFYANTHNISIKTCHINSACVDPPDSRVAERSSHEWKGFQRSFHPLRFINRRVVETRQLSTWQVCESNRSVRLQTGTPQKVFKLNTLKDKTPFYKRTSQKIPKDSLPSDQDSTVRASRVIAAAQRSILEENMMGYFLVCVFQFKHHATSRWEFIESWCSSLDSFCWHSVELVN